MPSLAVAADSHDLFVGGEIEALDGYLDAKDLCFEGHGQRILQDCEESRALLRVAVGIHQRLLDEGIELGRRETGLPSRSSVSLQTARPHS